MATFSFRYTVASWLTVSHCQRETADMTFFAKSWKTHAHISRSSRFVCRMHSSNLGIDVVAYSASAAVKEFTERLTGSSLRKKSGSEFFRFAKKSVQR